MGNGINRLEDLQPGDIMFGPIGGAVGLGVGLGQLALGEAFRAGKTSIRHVGIVVEAARTEGPSDEWPTGVMHGPRLVQAMPHGAEEVSMTYADHWTDRHAYARLMPDYAGQGEDAAAVARLMVTYKVRYSFASYAALALWRYGLRTPKLEAWINTRRPESLDLRLQNGLTVTGVHLPREAICSVLADQAWSLVGHHVMRNVAHQAGTPGAMANQLWRRSGTVWGFPGENPEPWASPRN